MKTTFRLIPVVTEKSTLDASENGVYQFKAPSWVNKVQVAQYFGSLKEKVKITKVAILNVRPKVRNLGKRTMTKRPAYKKVFVYLADKNHKLDMAQFAA